MPQDSDLAGPGLSPEICIFTELPQVIPVQAASDHTLRNIASFSYILLENAIQCIKQVKTIWSGWAPEICTNRA